MDHIITLKEAAAMTKRFRDNINTVIVPSLVGESIVANSETFDAGSIKKVLSQTDCIKLRLYYGMGENLKVHAIIVGVNSKDEDMLPTQVLGNDDDILDEGIRCPPICPPPSALNTD